jgi:DNA topoisomerase-6 subunit A
LKGNTKTFRERKKEVLSRLQGLGSNIYNQLSGGRFPTVNMPSRSTTNIVYDPDVRQYVLGERTVKRSAGNIRHLRPLTQLVWVGNITHKLAEEGKTSTLRDVYYMAQAYDVEFKNQQESDNAITELETVITHPRENFNLYPEERSAIFGDLTIEYSVPGYEGKRTNLTSHPDGLMIGPALETADLIETNAEIVICVEKGAMFTRFVEERAWEKFKAIIIHTAGQPPRATRSLIRRLNYELGLPTYIFCDSDPWGLGIALTVICGSANAAHLRELVTPDAKWLGLWPSDVVKYKLPTERMSEVDLKRTHDLLKDPRCQDDPWRRELKKFLEIKRKCELEAFSRYGLTFVVEKYLPEKLQIEK